MKPFSRHAVSCNRFTTISVASRTRGIGLPERRESSFVTLRPSDFEMSKVCFDDA
jgi:hypothetical protein